MEIMSIEDHYGDNQYFHYKSKSGDIILNKDTYEFKQIIKSRTRLYYLDLKDTIDVYHWLTDSKVELYRPKNKNTRIDEITIEQLLNLIEQGKLTLIITN
jgi:hypothetical protein